MAKTKWDLTKLITNAEREAGRIHDSANFLTPIERDTFVRVFEMVAWIIHDREHGYMEPIPDVDMQPLRDWMSRVGAARHEAAKAARRAHYVFPGFLERTSAEPTGEIVPMLRPGGQNPTP